MEEREILIARLRDVARELAALEAGLDDEAKIAHRDAVKDEFEDLLDRLNPTEAIPPPPPSDALAPEGLAIVVGHTARSQGAQALSPPFPADSRTTPLSERNEYAWNRGLALMIKERADRAGIRCEIFFRDGVGIEGAYAAVSRWSPKATVELHFNAASGNSRGSLVLYGSNESKSWAQALQKEFVRLYDRQGRNEDRGIFIPSPDSPYKRGIASVTQLQPSALIEPFFGDNRPDATLGIGKKDGLADAILAAYASFTGVTTSGPTSGTGTGSTARPRPIVPQADSSIPDVPLLRELIATYRVFTPTVPSLAPTVVERLKSITLAQWIEETGWARSELAAKHFNFAGMKAKSEVDAIIRDVPAKKVRYLAHDGLDTYLEFGSIRDFIQGYFMFLERSPYRGWHEMAKRSPHDFIRFIGRTWAQREGYASRVIGIERQLLNAGIVQSDGTLGDGSVAGIGDSTAVHGAAGVSSTKVKEQGATADFLTLVNSVAAETVLVPLLPVIVAQCALESDWGRSDLANIHANFAGIPWSDLFNEVAVAVPHPVEPARGTFCRFLSAATFLRAYRHRLDNDPAFAGWRMVGSAASFATFLSKTWRPSDPQYERKLMDIVARILPNDGSSGNTNAGGFTGQQPSDGTDGTAVVGVVLQIRRLRAEKRRGKGERTASMYQLFVDGRPVDGVAGMVLEPRGPGDNSPIGVQLHTRIKEGTYPLLTHAGSRHLAGVTKFKTIGFTTSAEAGAPPMPAIRVGNTKSRTGILLHPGDGYLWSIGCLNPTQQLTDATGNMSYADSRERVIDIVEALRGALANHFPNGNNETIRNATLEVIGEPGPAGIDALDSGTLSAETFAQQQLAVADAALAETSGDALAAPDLVAVHEALAAKMLAAALLGQAEDGAIDRIVGQGISLAEVRGSTGETLWTPWALAISAASVPGVVDRLSAVALRLRDAGVPLDDAVGAHSALVTAASGNDVRAIKALLGESASVDFRDRSGVTPLLAAAFFGAPEAVEVLLANGADPLAIVGSADEKTDLADSELASPGDDGIDCATAGAALVADDPARLDDYERVTALLWNAVNPR
ncbi:glucosaminidase domain-containing protein [Microvirga soli]|uniref:glucosaminidase domain-containing protein n=1 Tax=Microvirga soli TaxID=1854496 RepID=UPI00191F7256|nr:glucosaminidase domain-containing protein [Microvirga soli]